MSIEFFVGQQVVCVNDQYITHEGDHLKFTYPKLGSVYTIRGIFDDPEGLSFVLEELYNPYTEQYAGVNTWDFELRFFSWHFRPVKKTNIDVFTSMLNPVDHKELELV